jgi:hypothetical protein
MLDKLTLDKMNLWLKDNFGLVENQSRFRLVWSEDQYEIRKGTFDKLSDAGLYLGTEVGIKKIKKYPKYEKYILENLVPNYSDELVTKLSYEPVWVFGLKGDPSGVSLDPTWDALSFLLFCITSYKPGIGAKYLEDIPKTTEGIEEVKRQRIEKIAAELFGNETEVTDALAQRDAIVVPRNYGVNHAS